MAEAGAIHVRTMDLLAGQDPRGRFAAGSSTPRPRSSSARRARRRPSRATAASPARSARRRTRWSCTASPGKFKLRKGDILSVDIGVVKDGWVADGARTFPVGESRRSRRSCWRSPRSSLFRAVDQCSRQPARRRLERGADDGRGEGLLGGALARGPRHRPLDARGAADPELRPGREGRRARGGDGARDRADGHRRPPHGPDGRRRLGDLLPGRLAGRALRVHGGDHRGGPRILTPWHESGARARRSRDVLARSPCQLGRAACVRRGPCRGSPSRPRRGLRVGPGAASHAASAAARPHRPQPERRQPAGDRRLAPVALPRPSQSRPCTAGPRRPMLPGRPSARRLERGPARGVHLAGHPARAARAPAAVERIHGGGSAVPARAAVARAPPCRRPRRSGPATSGRARRGGSRRRASRARGRRPAARRGASRWRRPARSAPECWA